MSNIHELYADGSVNGWLGKDNPEFVKEQFALISSEGYIAPTLKIMQQTIETAGRKTMLYDVVRKVLGKCPVNINQEIGDCVSWGAKHASEYLQCVQILNGSTEKFRLVFSPYYYGTGRNYVGKNQIGWQDGSSGSWMAKAVQLYGTLFCDDEGVPDYSGQIAKRWGDSNSRDDLDKFVQVGQKRLVKGAALIQSWEDLVAAITNGYPCTVASDVGYEMNARSDGFHHRRGQWGHQMCFIGVDETYTEPYAIILNSWGEDAMGHLKDFQNGEDLPGGVLRVRKADAMAHIKQGETFAYSQFEGFVEQDIEKALFKFVGK